MNKSLAKFVQIVIFLFAAFGGFFKDIAPPVQTNSKLAVGLGSFLVLIVLLMMSAIAHHVAAARNYKRWLVAGCIFFILAVISGPSYLWTLNRLTYYYPPGVRAERKVQGFELTPIAKDLEDREHRQYSPAELELNLEYADIWTTRSLAQVELLLLSNYLCVILSISAAIFCFLEINSHKWKLK
jgi:hypothetical protein